jgi:hypothetical protein
MRDNLDPDSNVTAESDLQCEKHCSQSVFTEAGMQIDDSDEHSRNAQRGMQEI